MEQQMQFNEFVRTVQCGVKPLLPEDMQELGFKVDRFRKIGSDYASLTLCRGEACGAVVNLDEYYELYRSESKSLPEIIEEIAEVLQYRYPDMDAELSGILDYSWVKNNLFIRASNYKRNKDLLETVPHLVKEDLAITAHVLIEDHGQNIISTIVRKEMLLAYGVSEEELMHDALENSPRLFPPSLMRFDEMFAKKGIMYSPHNPEYRVLTNHQEINGAAVLFYPGMMERIADVLEGSYYIAPLSIHEVVLVKDNGDYDVEAAKRSLAYSALTDTSGSVFLSDHLYHYDAVKHSFSSASKPQERRLN